MLIKLNNKKAQSVLEYMTLIIFLVAAMFIFQKYFSRGISGRWKSVGDALGGGRLFSPTKTVECRFDPLYTDKWYEATCYDENCDEECLLATKNDNDCKQCILTCQSDFCD